MVVCNSVKAIEQSKVNVQIAYFITRRFIFVSYLALHSNPIITPNTTHTHTHTNHFFILTPTP